jgi:hypothetical protein
MSLSTEEKKATRNVHFSIFKTLFLKSKFVILHIFLRIIVELHLSFYVSNVCQENCCWSSPAESSFVSGPVGIRTHICSFQNFTYFETGPPLCWRSLTQRSNGAYRSLYAVWWNWLWSPSSHSIQGEIENAGEIKGISMLD